MQTETTIISIDTGDPKVIRSTTAIVKIVFSGEQKKRTAMAYVGSYTEMKEEIIKFTRDADHIVIEKIDATNSYISRSVVAEQLGVYRFLTKIYGDKVEEMTRSGRKQVITDELLKQVELWNEGDIKTHHNDVREATRNLLYFMAKSKTLNLILSNYVQRFFK